MKTYTIHSYKDVSKTKMHANNDTNFKWCSVIQYLAIIHHTHLGPVNDEQSIIRCKKLFPKAVVNVENDNAHLILRQLRRFYINVNGYTHAHAHDNKITLSIFLKPVSVIKTLIKTKVFDDINFIGRSPIIQTPVTEKDLVNANIAFTEQPVGNGIGERVFNDHMKEIHIIGKVEQNTIVNEFDEHMVNIYNNVEHAANTVYNQLSISTNLDKIEYGKIFN